MEKESWYGRRLRIADEEQDLSKFYNETWIIFFEEYLYCPIICFNVEHALAVYHTCIEVIKDGWLTYEQVCADDLGYHDNLSDKTHFLLTCCGICGIPLSLTDEEFWKDMVSSEHILV